MTLVRWAQIFGVVFFVIGVLGFFPTFAPNHHLLGVFHVNPLHNVVHIVSGLAALWASTVGTRASRTYFQIFGIIYGLVAILGFMFISEGYLFNLLALNPADNWLHVVIAAASLALGFSQSSVLRGHTRTGAVRGV